MTTKTVLIEVPIDTCLDGSGLNRFLAEIDGRIVEPAAQVHPHFEQMQGDSFGAEWADKYKALPQAQVPDGWEISRKSETGYILTRFEDGGAAYFDTNSPVVRECITAMFLEAMLAAAPSAESSRDSELPGMWESADLSGGATDVDMPNAEQDGGDGNE